MSVVHHLAQAAAILLLIELLVVLLLFLGIAGGLAFGLHWVNGKTSWAFDKVNHFAALGAKGVHTGTDLAGKPFILGAGLATRVEITTRVLKRELHRRRATESTPIPFQRLPGPTDLDATIAISTAAQPGAAAVPVPRPGASES